jgi:DNA-binding CsgD family transcriptional regulator
MRKVVGISKEKSVEDQILDLLKRHPEGLTSIDISRQLGIHRHTATKYVYMLLGAGKIFQRTVGVARICYLSKRVKI